MNRYQRTLLNKMDDLTARLQSDWRYKEMSKAERREMEGEIRTLQSKFNKSYKMA